MTEQKKEEKSATGPPIVKPGIGYVDTLVTNAILPTLPAWRTLRFTPNGLTTLGLVSSIACVYFLYQRQLGATLGCLAARWYFDYADGLTARKYNETSSFGDYYDHITDAVFTVGIAMVLVCGKYPSGSGKWCIDHLKPILLGVLAVFFALFMVQMGCIETHYHAEGEKETSISRLRHMCPEEMERVIKCFDNGTLYIVVAIILYLFCTVGKA